MNDEFTGPTQDAVVRQLYIKKVSRFSFDLNQGELYESLLEMYSVKAREHMGQRALILYSNEQVSTYRPWSDEQGKSEALDSTVSRQIKLLRSRQYKPARWAGISRPTNNSTHFHFSLVLDSQTQEQLHSCSLAGLNQSKFGRRVMEVAHMIPDDYMTETQRNRKLASALLRDAIWASDMKLEPNPLVVAQGQKNFVTNISWKTQIKN